ncbi:MAG: hypothetical protein ACK5MT_08330, partial [Actinomycetales bacterium]
VLADPAGVLMRHHTTPTTLNLTIDLPTLLGLAENPAHLAGYGPLPAHVARDLAGDATWTRIITDPITTTPLDISTRSYRPTAAIRRHLNHINQTCTFPGCTVPAARCDADHLTPYPQGPTSLDNLHHLCRPHHLLKTHQPGWQVHRNPTTGAIAWTTPTGQTGITYPTSYKHAHAPADQDAQGHAHPPGASQGETPAPADSHSNASDSAASDSAASDGAASDGGADRADHCSRLPNPDPGRLRDTGPAPARSTRYDRDPLREDAPTSAGDEAREVTRGGSDPNPQCSNRAPAPNSAQARTRTRDDVSHSVDAPVRHVSATGHVPSRPVGAAIDPYPHDPSPNDHTRSTRPDPKPEPPPTDRGNSPNIWTGPPDLPPPF